MGRLWKRHESGWRGSPVGDYTAYEGQLDAAEEGGQRVSQPHRLSNPVRVIVILSGVRFGRRVGYLS